MTEASTATWEQQQALEATVAALYQLVPRAPDELEGALALLRARHTRYLQGGLGSLPGGFAALGASRPWLCYWALHGLALLDGPLPPDISAAQVVAFLSSCQAASGGYGGGPGQLAHLAPTYAAVNALVTLGTPAALASVDRDAMRAFLLRVAVPPEQGGGFVMHEGGECDVRACYCALAVATHLQLDLQPLLERSGCVDYIRRCQTYEGGLGGEPGNEAHGGYTFCGLAALTLADATPVLDRPLLLRWAAARQAWVEGGFNGRTNKLADGCYSFWQGALFPLLQRLGPDALRRAPPAVGGSGGEATAAGQCASDDLPLPCLPPLHRVCGPLQRAERAARLCNGTAEALVEAAIAAQAARAESSTSAPTRHGAEASEGSAAARGPAGNAAAEPAIGLPSLLDRAVAAQQAAEAADEQAKIAASSAAVLFPIPSVWRAPSDGGDFASPDTSAGPLPSPCIDAAGEAAAAVAASVNTLMHSEALQLWILRACQQVKGGGLRDKPGKPADYYHSCYCLSGLAAAQQQPGGRVVGPWSNELGRIDPVLNVLEDKAAAARAFFSALPPP